MQKRVAYAELLNSKLRSDKLLARRDATRVAKLKAFLNQHQHASQWSQCIAALNDAAQHNITPSSEMLSDAIQRCGKRGMLNVARRIYTDFHREINKPRSMQVHLSYMAACADCGDFKEAHNQFLRLRQRDTVLLQKNASHTPIVNDEFTSEYLRAALVASTNFYNESHSKDPTVVEKTEKNLNDNSGDTNDNNLPWQVALREFISLRKGNEGFRKHVELTPVLVERVARLWEVGGEWEKCLHFLHSCAQQNILIPPEAYDAAIRLCYRHGQHVEVVGQMREMIATRSPPDERSVRLAVNSCEEVSAMERHALVPNPSTWALAVTLFDAMQNNGLTMYQQSYESPLRSCVMAGKWEDAMRILKIMKKDNRPISSQVYRLVLASRIEASSSFDEAQRFAQLPVMQNGGAVVYMSLLRCCMKLRDWKHFDRLNKEMRDREYPETFDKMRLLIEAAYLRGQWHSALMRFARFDNIANHEYKRVVEDKLVRLYQEDFDVPDSILDMVLESYEHMKDHKDPMVHVAYRAALKRKAKGKAQLSFSSLNEAATPPPPEWMFSHTERENQTSPKFF
ncbi:uncharacterized protein TM35_000112320 [Trypanosoma theileri]|uniref:Pentacotripeptide-repeat region of PRORP domain-containing protein n=1 Tax=Trypanosoma theileri TaxID=67003 RepID=A0A1X0NYR6_9TRYP|nr:uncharacterized protein TM35_000112320 [Trypanosoma theileri]ORC89698.1 hypothetical protein TM35_000112320 [Trypanosoma theileri]